MSEMPEMPEIRLFEIPTYSPFYICKKEEMREREEVKHAYVAAYPALQALA
jgi:hypothetical protein